MENRDSKLALWKEAVPRMNEEDLEFLLDFSECFDPKLVKMEKARYTELTKPQDDEEIHVAVIDSLAFFEYTQKENVDNLLLRF